MFLANRHFKQPFGKLMSTNNSPFKVILYLISKTKTLLLNNEDSFPTSDYSTKPQSSRQYGTGTKTEI